MKVIGLKIEYFVLGLILVVAFLLRVVQIGNFPVGFNADEASFGYDAYSILKTGKDQWGSSFPVVLKSFGDFKSPVYSYLAIPFIGAFGLNIITTRVPNVIIGTLSVLALYLLVNKIVEMSGLGKGKISKWLGVVAAAILAVNPWSVMMGRGAFEANLITFFLPIGIYFFLKGLRNNKFFVWSVVFLGINLFTYHSAKLITPLLLIGLVLIFRKQLFAIGFKKLFIPAILFLLFLSGLVYSFVIGGGSRIAERSITQGALEQGFQERTIALSKGINPVICKLLHNRYQVIAGRFTNNYLQYFSTRFYLSKGVGDASYGMIPGIGVVNPLEFILFFGTIPLFIFEKKSRNLFFALVAWLLIAPLSAALATGIGYSGNRAEGMIPSLQIVETMGFLGWILLARKIKIPLKFVFVVFAGVFIFGIYNFINLYFKVPNNIALNQEIYGSLEAATWLSNNNNGRTIIVSRSLTEAQIFVAFANKWDPIDFQEHTKTWGFNESKLSWVDQLPSYSLGNYTFKSVDPKVDMVGNKLVIVKADEFTGEQTPVKTFRYPDGTPDIYIIDTSQKVYAKTN
jgi:4-amino-4-deoxy-L-arabinose transferase-like glycosyltransferase